MEFRNEIPGPKRGRRPGGVLAWSDEAKSIRAKSPEWGLFRTFPFPEGWGSARSTGRNIRTGRLAAFRPAEHFEAATRRVGDIVELWVRYTGGVSKEDAAA